MCNSWEQPPKGHWIQGPRLPSQGPAQSPQKLPQPTAPALTQMEQKQRCPESWRQKGLGRTPPWSGEPMLAVPTCTEGSFLPFLKLGYNCF